MGLASLENFYGPLKSGDSVFPPYHDKNEKFLMSKKIIFQGRKKYIQNFFEMCLGCV